METAIETDYLVIGAGAGGMAFTDELLEHTDATVAIVDRRHAPGGHWVDAYPFVRLHQPSAFYGVSSVPLGHDRIDDAGTNAGFYELAGADEIRSYYDGVMRHRFLPSGRVRYFPNSEWVGEHRFVSRLTGVSTSVRVARKLVDATYVEGAIPATSPPPFEVADGVTCIPAGELAAIADGADRYVVVGAGKTALDACVWLLERDVPASAIQWIKPREAWWINRAFQQPHTLLPDLLSGTALQLEAMAQAASVHDLFERLESGGFFLRVDRDVAPTMFRGALIGEGELSLVRRIEDVVRMGRVQRIGRDEIVLDGGRVPTTPRTVHVHCAAGALSARSRRPIFEPGRVTVQPFAWSFACYQFATLAVLEATVESDDEKNRLVPPIPWWNDSADYAASFLALMAFEQARRAHSALSAWTSRTRLNPVSGAGAYRDDARVAATRERIRNAALPAAINLRTILAPQLPR